MFDVSNTIAQYRDFERRSKLALTLALNNHEPKWKIDSLEEAIKDSSEAIADLQRIK